jgi:hypothetical protein
LANAIDALKAVSLSITDASASFQTIRSNLKAKLCSLQGAPAAASASAAACSLSVSAFSAAAVSAAAATAAAAAALAAVLAFGSSALQVFQLVLG